MAAAAPVGFEAKYFLGAEQKGRLGLRIVGREEHRALDDLHPLEEPAAHSELANLVWRVSL
jgi:hypothetical protein